MKELYLEEKINDAGLSVDEIRKAIISSIDLKALKKVLIVPPDITRFYSNAGLITNIYYHYLTENNIEVDILPALGTHDPMTEEEVLSMFGDIPFEKFIVHDWRGGVESIGVVEKEFLMEVSEGLWDIPVDVQVNKLLMDPSYDLILSVGQIVPHEVVGIANHSKNLLVGCGGKTIIDNSHMLGAVYGMERMMGRDHTPVRKMFDYAYTNFLSHLPITFVLTVTSAPNNEIKTHGLYIGSLRDGFELGIKLVQKKNLDFLDKPLKKVVVYLEPKEFKSTWLGNKAVYRTRMAIADGGELIILAPGVTKFGEDLEIDKLIRKYGYVGRIKTLELFKNNQDLKDNMSVAAHLIHGSSDDRFKITYAVKNISEAEIKSVNFEAASYDELVKKYPIDKLTYGYNMVDGEEIYYIPNPALGLWVDKNKF